MSIAKDTHEHALVERLAVATQEVACLAPDVAGEYRCVGAAGENVDRPPNQIERLVSRQALAPAANAITRDAYRLRTPFVRGGSFRHLRCRLSRGRRNARFLGARFTLAVAPPSTAPTAAPLLPTATTGRPILARARFASVCSPGRRTHAVAVGGIDLELPVLELGHLQETALRGLLREPRELRMAQGLLIEVRVQLLHHLLEPVGAHDVAISLHALHRLRDQLPRVLLHQLFLAGLYQTSERVVAVVLIAVHHEQIAR
jgi:hypothetical protein